MLLPLLILSAICKPKAEVRQALTALNNAVNKMLKSRPAAATCPVRRKLQRLLNDKPMKTIVRANRTRRKGAEQPLHLSRFCEDYIAALGLPMLAARSRPSRDFLELSESAINVLVSQLLEDLRRD